MRFVHISDIHFGHGPRTHRIDQEMVINALIEDTALMANRLGSPDWLFLTGDVAFSGGALSDQAFDEYRVATERVAQLVTAAGIGLERVVVIPGNHDIDRRLTKGGAARSAVNETICGNPTALDAVLADQEDSRLLLSKLASFDAFALQFGPPSLRKAPREVTWSIQAASDYVVVGLNTALASGANDHPGALSLGNSQIVVIDRAPRDCFLIVLAHHPPKWLTDGSQLCNKLQHRRHLLLTGHEHTSDLFQGLRVGGGRLLHLTAGAAHGDLGETGRHGYAWGELRPTELAYWPRVWNRSHDGFVAAREDVPTLDSEDSILITLVSESPVRAESKAVDLRKEYCQQVIERLERHNSFLLGDYVALRCIDPFKPSDGVSDSLDVALRLVALESTITNRLAFLGDFGCGKTCLAQQLVLRLARHYFISDTKPVPVYLNLARSREYPSASAFVTAEIQRYLPEHEMTVKALLAEGRFVFVLDGLDEMPRDASLAEIRRCLLLLEDIHQLGSHNNWSVITSRTTFFKSQLEEGRLRDFRVRYIQPWGEAEWQRCLDSAGLGQIKDALDRIYSVSDLVRKPFFVKLIVENHEPIMDLVRRQGKVVSTDLYKLYVDRVLVDQVLKQTSVLDEHEKRLIIQRVALEMFFKDDTKLSIEAVAAVVTETLPNDARQHADLLTDVVNNTLFNRVMQDFVGFPHKSVMEYLVAERLSANCKQGIFTNYKRRFLYAELYLFCALLQADQTHVDRLFAELNNSRDQYFVPNALVILRVLRVFYQFEKEERLTRVLLRNLAAYAPEDLTARYSSSFSFWRCPFSPELPQALLNLYQHEPFGLIRRILWLTLEYYRDELKADLELPREGMNDTFAPELARETFALHPSGIDALLAVNLQGSAAPERGPYWIVQVGTSLFLSSSGEVRLLPAMLRDLSSPIRQLRENAVICLGNLLHQTESHNHVRERIQLFLSDEGQTLSEEIRASLATHVS